MINLKLDERYGDYKEVHSVYLKHSVGEQLRDYCKNQGRSKSWVVIKLLEEFFEKENQKKESVNIKDITNTA